MPARRVSDLVPAPVGLAGVRALNYVTNHLVNRVPSFTVRLWWYRRVVGVRIDPAARVHLGCYLWFFGPGHVRRVGVRIGSNSWIGRDCVIDARGPLSVGDHVSIAPEVAVITTQHDLRSTDFALESRGVAIGDHAWIGMRATILPGSQIGRGAVVAAGAVVAGTVEPLSIVAGIPARVVGHRPDVATHYNLAGDPPWFE